MTVDVTAEAIANTALCVLAIVMVIFTATYTLGSPWWLTRLGQIYAVQSVLLALVLMQNALSVLTDQDYPARHLIRMVIYCGGALSMIALFAVLRRYQREGKLQRRDIGDHRSRWRVWMDTIRDWADRS